MLNILSLYKFSTFADLKRYCVCSDFVLLKALRQPSQKFWPKILTPYFFTLISTYTS